MLFRSALGGVGKVDFIGTDAAPVVGAAVLAVQGVPGVGKSDSFKGLTVLGEQGLGQQGNIAHDDRLLFDIGRLAFIIDHANTTI